MRVYIPNMEKPKICGECPLFIDHCYFDGNEWHNGCFSLEREIFEDELAPDCPLIEIDDEAIDIAQDIIDGCKRFKERRADESNTERD